MNVLVTLDSLGYFKQKQDEQNDTKYFLNTDITELINSICLKADLVQVVSSNPSEDKPISEKCAADIIKKIDSSSGSSGTATINKIKEVVTLGTDKWDETTCLQTVAVTGVTADSLIILGLPNGTAKEVYSIISDACITVDDQSADTVVLKVNGVMPTQDVNIEVFAI